MRRARRCPKTGPRHPPVPRLRGHRFSHRTPALPRPCSRAPRHPSTPLQPNLPHRSHLPLRRPALRFRRERPMASPRRRRLLRQLHHLLVTALPVRCSARRASRSLHRPRRCARRPDGRSRRLQAWVAVARCLAGAPLQVRVVPGNAPVDFHPVRPKAGLRVPVGSRAVVQVVDAQAVSPAVHLAPAEGCPAVQAEAAPQVPARRQEVAVGPVDPRSVVRRAVDGTPKSSSRSKFRSTCPRARRFRRTRSSSSGAARPKSSGPS